MIQTPQLELLDQILSEPRSWWSSSEHSSPTTLDKLLHYLLSYCCDPSSARRAVRLFKGIDSVNGVCFSSWNEVRVSSLADIREGLELSGCRGPTWEVAVLLKDFLQNLFDTIGICDFDDELEAKEISLYLDQLGGKPDSWEKGEIAPHRPANSSWSRKNVRKPGERMLPDAVFQYLRFLLGISSAAPLDYHSEKVLTRWGVLSPEMSLLHKKAVYHQLLTTTKPISKHRKIVEFSKLVCLEKQPRCGICPFQSSCKFERKIC